MISRLKLQSSLLQAKVDLELHPNLNVFTGETGTGKSLLLEGIAFALGSSRSRFSQGDAEVELVFPKEQICRKAKETKNRYFLNGKLAKATAVRAIACDRITIQAQGAAQLFWGEQAQLLLLDRYLGKQCQTLLQATQTAYSAWQAAVRHLSTLEQEREAVEKQKEWLAFQLQELSTLDLKEGEEAELRQRLEEVDHQELIQAALQKAYDTLYRRERSASEGIAEALQALQNIRQLSSTARSVLQPLQSLEETLSEQVIVPLRDAVQNDALGKDDADQLRDRFFTLQELKRKHGTDLTGLLALQQELEKKLQWAEGGEEVLSPARKKVETTRKELQRCCKKLSALRKRGARALEQEIKQHLSDLLLSSALFSIALEKREIQENGWDRAAFLFSSSQDRKLQPLTSVASGGERSRVLLSLSAAIAKHQKSSTLILDEVETGVGGEAAIQMGRKLRELARHRQVLLVTHQPAIAAYAQAHFRVERTLAQDGVVVKKLNRRERLEELSRMLKGKSRTTSARALASELLSEAAKK